MTIAIIGAGAVGSTIAYALAIKNLAADIVMIDVNEAKTVGEAMDIRDGLSLVATGRITAGTFRDARTADIIILTAGAAQKPGESRLDLVTKNIAITKSIFRSIGRIKKDSIILVVTNPMDIITRIVQTIVRLPHARIFGSGTTLDTVRLKLALGTHFGVSSHGVHGFVIGEHGDSELIAWSTVTVGGIPIDRLPMTEKQKKDIGDAVKNEAYAIIEKTGATHYGIGLVVTDIVASIIFDQKRILPVSSRLTNWHGISDLCLGAPAVVGRDGIERLWPLSLAKDERKRFQASADLVRSYMGKA